MTVKHRNVRAEGGAMISRSLLGNLIGRVLLGRYRIVRELARGGMGVVYLARAEGAGGFVRPVVVKLVLPQHTADTRFVGMFVREAQILSELRHPNIVPVLDFGEEHGAYVMVLEYIRGYHLGQWSKYAQKKQRDIPTDLLMFLMVDVLEALHKAHCMRHRDGSSMQIVHRDVSPSNILMDEDGRARLLDFGAARMRGGAVSYETQFRSFVGKFSYSAPELFGGAEGTPGSDVYSCAVVLHELLFGRNAFFGADDAATINLVLNHAADPVEPVRPDAPRGLDAVLQKALAKEPSKRFSDASELAAALRNLQTSTESELRARVVGRLREDFTDAMAAALGVESLSARERSWREADAESSEQTMMLELDQIAIDEPETRLDVEPESSVRASRSAPRPTASTPRNLGSVPGAQTGAFPRVQASPPPVPPPTTPVHEPQVSGALRRGRAFFSGFTADRQVLAAVVIVACLVVVALVLSLTARVPAPTPRIIHVTSGQEVPSSLQRNE